MTRGERNRKALSPLLATVLLIAFAVSLGTLIMSWTIDQPLEDPCESTALELQSTADGTALCYDAEGQRVRFLVRNTGETPISQLQLEVIDPQQNVGQQDVNADLDSGDLGKFEILFETPTPARLVGSIIPVVMHGDEPKACLDQQIQEQQVPLC